MRIVKTGEGEEPDVGGGTGFGLDSVPSDTHFCLMESTVDDCVCWSSKGVWLRLDRLVVFELDFDFANDGISG